MSLGAISRETHEAIAIAITMNRIGWKSNSGEGGEVGQIKYIAIIKLVMSGSSSEIAHRFAYGLILQDPIRWSPLTDVVDGYSQTLPQGLQTGTPPQVPLSRCSINCFILALHRGYYK
jgi:glutamate synthase (ferredoxin)